MRKVPLIVALAVAACGPMKPRGPDMSRFDGPPWRGDVATNTRWHFADLPGNGLKVIVLPEPSAPTVTVITRLPVGGKDDPDGKSGLAHLSEHAVFLRRGADGRTIQDAVDEIAVWSNAVTGITSTTFYTSVLPTDLDAALAIQRRLLTDPCEIDDARFAVEREVVLNELRVRGIDELGGDPSRFLPGLKFPGGSETEVSAAARADACQFMDDHYSVSSAVMVIAGPIEIAPAMKAAIAQLDGAPARAFVDPKPAPGRQSFAAALTGVNTEDTAEAWVLYQLPDEPTMSPQILPFLASNLTAALRHGKPPGWIDDVGVASTRQFGTRLIAVWATAKKGKRADADSVAGWAKTSVDKAISDGILWGTDEKWTQKHGEDLQLELESLTERAVRFAELAATVPAEQLPTAFEPFNLVSLATENMLRDLVVPGRSRRMTLSPRTSDDDDDDATGAPAAPRRPATRRTSLGGARALLAGLHDARGSASAVRLPADPLPGRQSRTFVLDNGLPVYLEDTGAASPATSVVLTIDYGDAHGPGEARAVERFTVAPTLIAAEDRTVTHDATYYVLQDVSRDLPALLQVARESAFRPRLVRPWVNDKIRSKAEHLEEYFMTDPNAVMRRRLFGALHPYGKATRLPETTGFDTDDVERLRRAHYRPDAAALYVVGRFDLDLAEAQIRHYLGGWPERTGAAPAIDVPRVAPRPGFVTIVDDESPNQVSIRIAFATPPERDADRPARLLLAEVLRRRAWLLREREGVTYTPDVEVESLRWAGYVGLEVAVDPRYVATAVNSLEQLLADLRTTGPTDEELAYARRIVVRRVLAGEGTSAARAIALARRDILGRRQSDEQLLVKLVEVSRDEVRGEAGRLLPEGQQVLLLTGKRDQIKAATVALRRTPDETLTRPDVDDD